MTTRRRVIAAKQEKRERRSRRGRIVGYRSVNDNRNEHEPRSGVYEAVMVVIIRDGAQQQAGCGWCMEDDDSDPDGAYAAK